MAKAEMSGSKLRTEDVECTRTRVWLGQYFGRVLWRLWQRRAKKDLADAGPLKEKNFKRGRD